MKDIGKEILLMAWEDSSIKTEMCTKDPGKKEKPMAMENISTQTVPDM